VGDVAGGTAQGYSYNPGTNRLVSVIEPAGTRGVVDDERASITDG